MTYYHPPPPPPPTPLIYHSTKKGQNWHTKPLEQNPSNYDFPNNATLGQLPSLSKTPAKPCRQELQETGEMSQSEFNTSSSISF